MCGALLVHEIPNTSCLAHLDACYFHFLFAKIALLEVGLEFQFTDFYCFNACLCILYFIHIHIIFQ